MIAGQIVWLDFRKDAVPKEANKVRPGIVVEDAGIFAPQFPNVVVVPCTTTLTFEVPSLCVRIDPDDHNGLDRSNWAVSHGLTTASKSRIVEATEHHVSPQQLAEIRAHIVEMLGVLYL